MNKLIKAIEQGENIKVTYHHSEKRSSISIEFDYNANDLLSVRCKFTYDEEDLALGFGGDDSAEIIYNRPVRISSMCHDNALAFITRQLIKLSDKLKTME